MRRWRVAVVAAALACALGPPAHAAPGQRDAAFGIGGYARVVLGNHDGAGDVVLLPDGKILVSGGSIGGVGDPGNASSRWVLLRLLPDGRLDPEWGEAGVIRTSFGQYNTPTELIRLRDGRLLVVGWTYGYPRSGIAMARYLPDGRLDPSFGTGGKVVATVPGDYAFGESAAVLPDGRIVVVGSTVKKFGSAFLHRFLADGRPDRSFGAGGVLVPRFGDPTQNERADAVVALPDGSVVVSGNSGRGPMLVRYTKAGRRDPSFGSTGFPVDARFTGLSRTPDGGYVVGGAKFGTALGNVPLVAKFTRTGRLDPRFGRGGVFAGDAQGWAVAPAVDARGRLLVNGNIRRTTYDPLLLRLLPDGRPDESFGAGGYAVTDGGLDEGGGQPAIGPDGSLVFAGYAQASVPPGTPLPPPGSHIVVARFSG